jgi:hypothetical protein
VGLHACKGITDEQKLVLSLHDQPLAKWPKTVPHTLNHGDCRDADKRDLLILLSNRGRVLIFGWSRRFGFSLIWKTGKWRPCAFPRRIPCKYIRIYRLYWSWMEWLQLHPVLRLRRDREKHLWLIWTGFQDANAAGTASATPTGFWSLKVFLVRPFDFPDDWTWVQFHEGVET